MNAPMGGRRRAGVALVVSLSIGLVASVATLTPAASAAASGATSVAVTDLTRGATPRGLAQSLAGSGVAISNVTYTGDVRAAGGFTGGASSIGLDAGVVLSSGKVETDPGDRGCSVGVEGPNTCYEAVGRSSGGVSGRGDSTVFGTAGDPDLDALVAPWRTHDAAVLQFDFVPTEPVIQIRYVFGSEEYSDFVNKFDDVFGFFVNGQDCALVPGTDEPVSVNTINDGSDAPGGDRTPHNPQLFRDNVRPAPSIDSQLDGLTTVLTCTAQVRAGHENHMKLAIGDTRDPRLDSAVFLGAASFISAIQSGPTRTFTGTAPDTVSGPLATFTDPNHSTTPGSYTSTINWGDGTTTNGTITGSEGSFTVSGDHTYSAPGSYAVTVMTSAVANPTNTTTTIDQATIRGKISAIGATPITGAAPTTISGEVAEFTVADPTATAASYTATIDWGDGTTTAGTVTGSAGRFAVSGDHTYASPGTYTIRVTISDVHDPSNSTVATNTADIAPVCPGAAAQSAPLIGPGSRARVATSTALVSVPVSTCGLGTTVYLQYGLDNRYRANPTSNIDYDQQTDSQPLAASPSSTTVQVHLSGLVAHALYHARLVATNSAGTTVGGDQTFTTQADGTVTAAPARPVLGKTFDARVVSGLVLIHLPGHAAATAHGGRSVRVTLPGSHGFFPLTEALSLPVGTRVDARRGSLELTAATPRARRTEAGEFTSGLFSVTQDRRGAARGLTTISLVEGAFPGAPSYAACRRAQGSSVVRAQIARLSSRVLQTLHARAHGRFRTVGHYSAGTVRGTKWDTIERCDGTLTVVQLHTVDVYDFTRHVTVAVHAGHRYLARAPGG